MQAAISDVGLGNPSIVHDGRIHRFTGPDDRTGSNACWYVSFGSAGAFGSWKLGFTHRWCDASYRSSTNDFKLSRQIRAAKQLRKNKIIRKQKQAQESARLLWSSGETADGHPYLLHKHIMTIQCRQKRGALLIPMYCNGDLWNLQQIFANGAKRFLKGGRVTGCYTPLGKLEEHVLICEGYATGCTLHQHLTKPVVVAFSAVNLKQVAKAVRRKFPTINITLAADNDSNTKGNPGLSNAREAAAVVGGDLIYPDFSQLERQGSDFNDYVIAGGVL